MTVPVTLLHTNDMHDRRSALQRLRTMERPAHTVLADVGDSLRGSNTLWYWDEPVLAEMNRLDYQVQAMGNREFHYLRRVLAHRERCRTFPLLAANLEDLRGTPQGWQDRLVLEVGGFRLGFTGITPVQYGHGAVWERLFGFRFHPPEDVLPDLIRTLRQECHVVILLSHVGYAEDRRLAPLLPGLDLIVGGHSHTVLAQADRQGGTPIVQTGSHGRFVGRTTLHLSAAGAVEGMDYELLPSSPP